MGFKGRKNSITQRKFNLEQTIDQFLDDRRLQKRSERTIQTYKQTLSHFANFCVDRGLDGSEPDCVREYIRWLTFEKVRWDDHPTSPEGDIGVSARTANNTIRNLRVFYNWCIKKKLLAESPADQVGYQTEEEESFEVFTDEEVEAMLNAPNRRVYTGFRDYVMMVLIVDTGLRVGEMTSLVRGDIDLLYRQIHIRAEIAKPRRTRTVPFSATTADLLRELFEYIGVGDDDTDEYVFLTQYGDRYYGDTFAKMLKKYAKRTGLSIKGRVSPHTFRHYFAVKFLRNGGNQFALMKILGHADIAMTQRYVRYIDSDLKEAHDKASPIDSIFERKQRKRGSVKFR